MGWRTRPPDSAHGLEQRLVLAHRGRRRAPGPTIGGEGQRDAGPAFVDVSRPGFLRPSAARSGSGRFRAAGSSPTGVDGRDRRRATRAGSSRARPATASQPASKMVEASSTSQSLADQGVGVRADAGCRAPWRRADSRRRRAQGAAPNRHATARREVHRHRPAPRAERAATRAVSSEQLFASTTTSNLATRSSVRSDNRLSMQAPMRSASSRAGTATATRRRDVRLGPRRGELKRRGNGGLGGNVPASSVRTWPSTATSVLCIVRNPL